MLTKRLTVITFAGATFLAALALWPLTPSLDALTQERATVRSIAADAMVTQTVFRTSSGAEVACTRGKSGGCPTEQLKTLHASQREFMVWHDGARVYQIADSEKVLYSYGDMSRGRGFLLAIAMVIALAGLIQVAVHARLINRYDETGKLR